MRLGNHGAAIAAVAKAVIKILQEEGDHDRI